MSQDVKIRRPGPDACLGLCEVSDRAEFRSCWHLTSWRIRTSMQTRTSTLKVIEPG